MMSWRFKQGSGHKYQPCCCTLVRELAMLQFTIGRNLFEATGTEQSIARDLLEVAHSPDAAQIKRSDRRRLVGRQESPYS